MGGGDAVHYRVTYVTMCFLLSAGFVGMKRTEAAAASGLRISNRKNEKRKGLNVSVCACTWLNDEVDLTANQIKNAKRVQGWSSSENSLFHFVLVNCGLDCLPGCGMKGMCLWAHDVTPALTQLPVAVNLTCKLPRLVFPASASVLLFTPAASSETTKQLKSALAFLPKPALSVLPCLSKPTVPLLSNKAVRWVTGDQRRLS